MKLIEVKKALATEKQLRPWATNSLALPSRCLNFHSYHVNSSHTKSLYL
jgi:hypothetical protein